MRSKYSDFCHSLTAVISPLRAKRRMLGELAWLSSLLGFWDHSCVAFGWTGPKCSSEHFSTEIAILIGPVESVCCLQHPKDITKIISLNAKLLFKFIGLINVANANCWLHSHLSKIMIDVCVPFVPRQTLFAMYILTLIGMLVFAFTLSLGHLWLVFITVGTLGWAAIQQGRKCRKITFYYVDFLFWTKIPADHCLFVFILSAASSCLVIYLWGLSMGSSSPTQNLREPHLGCLIFWLRSVNVAFLPPSRDAKETSGRKKVLFSPPDIWNPFHHLRRKGYR